MTARSRFSLALLLGCGVSLPALAGAAPQSAFDAVSISPTGATVATVTHDPAQGHDGETTLLLRPVAGGPAVRVALPCGGAGCEASAPSWSADGKRLVFVLQVPNGEEQSLWETDDTGAAPHKLLGFAGLLDTPRFSKHGVLSVLAVEHPHKKTGATAAAATMTGEVGDVVDEQRIALVENGALRFVSPAGLYVYEYDLSLIHI